MEFRISDDFNELLVKHCSLEYAKKLAEFDFITVSAKVFLIVIGSYEYCFGKYRKLQPDGK